MIPKTMTRRLILGLACVVLACAAAPAFGSEEVRKLKSDPSQEYYLYLPAKIDPAKKYWLFVGVHGLGGNGKGAMGWSSFAEEGQCIVVGPSFTGTFQFPTNGSGAGKGMLGIFKELSHEYKLYPKAFVTGFSAGAQFAHRFALENPQLVVGCAAHSAGSWGMPNAKARGVPFVVTCGEDDKERIGLAKEFARDAKSKGFQVSSAWFKGVGHSFCPDGQKMTKDLFWTSTTGMTIEQREEALADLGKADKLAAEGKPGEAAQAVRKLALSKRQNELTERAAALVKQIEKTGKEKLAEIREQAKTDVAAAVAAIEKLQQDFEGTRVASAAKDALQGLKGGAAAPPKKSETVEPKESTDPPPKKDTAAPPQDDKAKRDRTGWLRMAKNYIANGNSDRAIEFLSKVIDTYPDSDEAKEALALRKNL